MLRLKIKWKACRLSWKKGSRTSRADKLRECKMTLALEGLNIIDLSRYAPGPYCTMILGDLGANITKIDEVTVIPGPGAEQGKVSVGTVVPELASNDSRCNAFNRNKKSICLNLKAARGRDIFLHLAKDADVVVEGFRPGVTKRLGIDYATLKEKNERLIYCAITGYGQDGPYNNLPGHDINYIAQGGMTSTISLPGATPRPPGAVIGDLAAGGMQAAIGILAAVIAREKTGKGQFIDIAMTDGVINMLGLYLGKYYENMRLPSPEERSSCGGTPYYNNYQTSDGKFIAIGCGEPWFYANLCRVLECEQYTPFQGDSDKYGEITAYFIEKFLQRTRDEWFELLAAADIPVSKVLALDELETDPHVQARNMILEVASDGEKVKQSGISIKLSETPGEIRSPSVRPGENTSEILIKLGYRSEEIQELKHEGVVNTRE
jgi:crotonobetainyl-CoA:carnitine CoA-transferase CaiB-like acyl-CoA transferase